MKRIYAFFKTDWGIALAISLVWQIGLTLLGWALTPHLGVLGHMVNWDAGWYHHIIEHSYTTTGSPAAPAFYPLFPMIISVLTTITFGAIPLTLLALVVNTVALWFAITGLVRIVRHFTTHKLAPYIAVLGLLTFPSAFFMHVFYSEALFIALAVWTYYFTLKRSWWKMAILLAALTATRLPSLLVIGLCGLEYLRAYSWNIKKAFNKNLLWFLLAPVGFISYGLYLLAIRGDFLAMFHAYDATNDWIYQEFNINIFSTLAASASHVVTSLLEGTLNYEIFINNALPLASLLAILLSSLYLLYHFKHKAIPLASFGIVSIVFFTLNSNIVSVHRYTLAVFVIYVAVAALGIRYKPLRWIIFFGCLASLVVQLFLYMKFINGMFGG